MMRVAVGRHSRCELPQVAYLRTDKSCLRSPQGVTSPQESPRVVTGRPRSPKVAMIILDWVRVSYLKIAHFNLTRSNILYSKIGYLKIAHFRIQDVTSYQVKMDYLKIAHLY